MPVVCKELQVEHMNKTGVKSKRKSEFLGKKNVKALFSDLGTWAEERGMS